MVKQLKQICSSEGEQMESRPWYDLPVEILNLIHSRLPIVEQFHFRIVCKSWHLVEAHFERNLPWVLCHFWDDSGPNCSFHIPSLNQTHIVSDHVMVNLWDAGISASKHGWLLLQQSNETFFFNPFSAKVIKLPNMDISFNRATFTSSPTCPDCICFAIGSSKSCDKILISTCSPGDLKWRTTTLDGFNKVVEDVVYSNGSFYCVFSGGVLGAFFVEDYSWSMLTDTEPNNRIFSWSRLQLVESNGEILLVSRTTNFCVFKFDQSDMVWKDVNKLGNRALFLGCTSFAVEAEGKTSALAGRIYYHEYPRFSFYSLHTEKTYTCEDFYPWVVPNAQGKIWIEPPSF